MRTRYGVSPWIDALPSARRPSWPRLKGDDVADVVVIGGGLTGCAIAFALAQAGRRPVLIEADRIGQAATGHQSGWLGPAPGPAFRAIQQAHGLRVARTVFETWRRGALEAAALLRRANIRSEVAPCDSLLLAAPDGGRGLRRELEAREAASVEAGWLTGKQIRSSARLESAGGLRERGGFTLDPYRTCLGLATAAVRRAARVFERSKVEKVRAAVHDVEIVLAGGVIRANTVIVATGLATAEFKPLRRHFKRRERYQVLTEPIAAAIRKQMFGEGLMLQDGRTPGRRFRWTGDHRLLISGADQDETPAARHDAVLVQRTGQLMYEALMLYPAISGLKPVYGWDMAYGATGDGLPYIGAHRNYPHHLFALGGTGDSVTAAFLAARILTRALQGEAQKGDEVFAWTR